MRLIEEISKYTAIGEAEKADKEAFLQFLKYFGDAAYSRENLIAHLTASAWIVNADRSKVLLCYHRLYQSWSWLGGHADGDRDLAAVALREAKEESGLKQLAIANEILDLSVLSVAAHVKRGKYVPNHLHYNLTYLIAANEKEDLVCAPEENSALKWVQAEDVAKMSSESHMIPIYERIIAKTRK